MENKDKNIDKHFRKLSEEQEPKSFPNMDKVWDKIEEKLDRKETKKAVPFWKYAGIAAALLVFVTLGIQFMNNRSEKEEFPVDNEQRIVIDERKAKEILDEEMDSTEDIYAFEEVENQEENKQDKTQFIQTPIKKGSEVVKEAVTTQEDFDDVKLSGRGNREVSSELKSEGIMTGGADKGSKGTGIAYDYDTNEIIVDSYRTTSKVASNTTASTVTAKTIEGRPNASFVQTLQGQVSGLNISTGSEQTFMPNERSLYPINRVVENSESYENFTENPFENAQSNPVSTFSIDVDNAAYTNIRRFINNGQTVPKDAVRVEEMINFFKYDYAQPSSRHPFAIHTEYSDAPWNPNHKLLRIGLKGKEIPTDKLPKSNLVFLVDLSGSMSSQNKLPLLKSSLKVLLDELRPDDRVSIVYYANNVGVLLEPTKASEKQKIIEAIDKMNASGGTSGGGGIELAYEMAEKHFLKDGNNRIILATDGDFNIGKSSDKEMQELIEEKRKSGVFLTCLGFGMGNYKDSKLMTLSKKGNGNYAYIDNIQEANRFLGKEFKGSMFAIAKDVKIQIEFNPAHVQSYRLIGYEMRKLRNEDFTNDAIDAGELGSGHTVTALYEVIPNGVKSDFYSYENDLKYTKNTASGSFQNELATVKFRYKKPKEDKSIEMVHTVENKPTGLKNASKDFKFASAVAWFGLKLRDSKLITNKESKDIVTLAREGIQNDDDGYKAEFIRLVESVK